MRLASPGALARCRLTATILAAALTACSADDLSSDPGPITGPPPAAAAASTTTQPSEVGVKPQTDVELDLVLVVEAAEPIALVQRPGTTSLFLAQKGGQVLNLSTEEVVLDLSGVISQGSEQGLLGIAFSPDGSSLLTNTTDVDGATRIDRYAMEQNGPDVGSKVELLSIPQPYGNHNGGHLVFGPDDYLYVGMGDGGSGGDPEGNGQNPATLLGSILRIAPTEFGYTIPPDNPFADGGSGAPEVLLWGLRNPWRFSFDSANGDLWIGDVGQNRLEEITVIRNGTNLTEGANLGWNAFEANESFEGGSETLDYVEPFASYGHDNGRCSVTGGVVYRGSGISELVGAYIFGDFCSGEILAIDATGSGQIVPLDIGKVNQLTSFAIDQAGEMYVLSLAGGVYQIVPRR